MRRSGASDMGTGVYDGVSYPNDDSRVVENFKLKLNKMVAKVDEVCISIWLEKESLSFSGGRIIIGLDWCL